MSTITRLSKLLEMQKISEELQTDLSDSSRSCNSDPIASSSFFKDLDQLVIATEKYTITNISKLNFEELIEGIKIDRILLNDACIKAIHQMLKTHRCNVKMLITADIISRLIQLCHVNTPIEVLMSILPLINTIYSLETDKSSKEKQTLSSKYFKNIINALHILSVYEVIPLLILTIRCYGTLTLYNTDSDARYSILCSNYDKYNLQDQIERKANMDEFAVHRFVRKWREEIQFKSIPFVIINLVQQYY
eukprot:472762_1